ncbi:methylated-DNA--[protein]-cysteine S-methyltransferase [Clostridium rectalis]|uniref:methylated-DNA--[protein]-cysteine S-methyltransferase n=1 Tax=Clostridium rectalis TaxID=2040295 RepID=UPI0019D18A07|nr:methylated-DNA--[protein]-cysteine S-methyltransferase [Clostridium rectalis]
MIKIFEDYYKSPIGYIKITSSDNTILAVNFIDSINKKSSNNSITSMCISQLDEYFKGIRKMFNLPISPNGTNFQNRVWNELTNIPYGTTVSYKDIGEKIGNKNYSRAVGNANNKNKIVIIIPCHRIIGSNKKLVGYAGGLWRKQWLIEHEKIHLTK